VQKSSICFTIQQHLEPFLFHPIDMLLLLANVLIQSRLVSYIFTFLLQICFCHSGHGCVTFTCYPFVYHSGACFCQGLTTLYLNTLILTSSVRICDIGQQYPFDFSVIYYMSYTPDSFNKSSYVCQCRCKKIAVSFLTFKLENCSNPTFSGILCSFIYNSCLNILTFVLENCHTFQKLANYLV